MIASMTVNIGLIATYNSLSNVDEIKSNLPMEVLTADESSGDIWDDIHVSEMYTPDHKYHAIRRNADDYYFVMPFLMDSFDADDGVDLLEPPDGSDHHNDYIIREGYPGWRMDHFVIMDYYNSDIVTIGAGGYTLSYDPFGLYLLKSISVNQRTCIGGDFAGSYVVKKQHYETNPLLDELVFCDVDRLSLSLMNICIKHPHVSNRYG